MFLLLCLLFSFLLSHCKKFISSPLDSVHLSLGYQLFFPSQNFYFLMCNHVGHDKGPYSQSCGFSIVMYRCESWTIRKAEHQRIDAFELWCWRRLLRVPWTAGRSAQSILKEISPEYSLEELMMKLELQYFGHLMQRPDSLKKTLLLGKMESRRRRGNRG